MLAGEQGTGKTTIARYLVGKEPTNNRISTDGIDLYNGLSFIDRETEEWLHGTQGIFQKLVPNKILHYQSLTISRSLLREENTLTDLKANEKTENPEKSSLDKHCSSEFLPANMPLVTDGSAHCSSHVPFLTAKEDSALNDSVHVNNAATLVNLAHVEEEHSEEFDISGSLLQEDDTLTDLKENEKTENQDKSSLERHGSSEFLPANMPLVTDGSAHCSSQVPLMTAKEDSALNDSVHVNNAVTLVNLAHVEEEHSEEVDVSISLPQEEDTLTDLKENEKTENQDKSSLERHGSSEFLPANMPLVTDGSAHCSSHVPLMTAKEDSALNDSVHVNNAATLVNLTHVEEEHSEGESFITSTDDQLPKQKVDISISLLQEEDTWTDLKENEETENQDKSSLERHGSSEFPPANLSLAIDGSAHNGSHVPFMTVKDDDSVHVNDAANLMNLSHVEEDIILKVNLFITSTFDKLPKQSEKNSAKLDGF
ncbi:unnamed protein product [Mytilus edulis]|uniref:Uncharacterized protein n=1 Tax=Mytilus edulis TaxID=6550 RepID=A0A8S3UZL9_MYTED|nr:unnamed protein product [Mytilus edulis]